MTYIFGEKVHHELLKLEETGFKNVDCYYKFGIFAIFGGTKDV